MLVALFALAIAADAPLAMYQPVVFAERARTACAYDAEVGRYECDDVDSAAVVVETVIVGVPAGVEIAVRLRDSDRCFVPGVEVHINSVGVVVDTAAVTLSVDGRAVAPVVSGDAANLIIVDDQKSCWRARGVSLTVPLSFNGATSTVSWQADIRRNPDARQVVAARTPEPPKPAALTKPVAPAGYAGVVPEPDQTPRIVAAVVGGLVGVGVGAGVIAALNAAQPDLFAGALPSAVLGIVVLGGAGAGVGGLLVQASPDLRAEAFARYALAQQEYDDAVDDNARIARQHAAWVELQQRSAL